MEQTIFVNSIDGIKKIQYIIALSNITKASIIIFASRISNNRFCTFLKNQQIADDIINNRTAIYKDNIKIPLRKLINPSKRIILSNVYPAIPNDTIIKALDKLEIKITSPITALKTGFKLDNFSHITSFRRQLYINPDDFSKFPGLIPVSSDNTIYQVFIIDNTVTCYCANILSIYRRKNTNSNSNLLEKMDISTNINH